MKELPYQRLYVNIDHVATVRQARRGAEPDPVAAALLCESFGVDGITAHLREDRRHIQDADIELLSARIKTVLNLECAATEEMIALAERLKPAAVTLVPEKREEVTTEGGLDVVHFRDSLRPVLARLKRAGVKSSLFIDPVDEMVRVSREIGADAIELHTGRYANLVAAGAGAGDAGDATGAAEALAEALKDLARAAGYARSLGLKVHAGHGLTARNVGAVAAIPEIEELNIGHSIIAQAIFTGLEDAVTAIRRAMDEARNRPANG